MSRSDGGILSILMEYSDVEKGNKKENVKQRRIIEVPAVLRIHDADPCLSLDPDPDPGSCYFRH